MNGWQCDACRTINKKRSRTCHTCGARVGDRRTGEQGSLFRERPQSATASATAAAWRVPEGQDAAMAAGSPSLPWQPGAPGALTPVMRPTFDLDGPVRTRPRIRRITHVWTALALPAVLFYFAVAGLSR